MSNVELSIDTNVIDFSILGNEIDINVTGSNSIDFILSDTGPQGAVGAPGSIFSEVINETSSINVTADQNGALFTNYGASGEVDFNLPVALSPFRLLGFSFLVGAGQTVSVNLPAGVQLQNGGDISSAEGSFYSNTPGNFLTVIMISPTLWLATQITGVWNTL